MIGNAWCLSAGFNQLEIIGELALDNGVCTIAETKLSSTGDVNYPVQFTSYDAETKSWLERTGWNWVLGYQTSLRYSPIFLFRSTN